MNAQSRPTKTKTPIVVVESHHHVLEHIHQALRRRKPPRDVQRPSAASLQPWSMIHFDAHPDLACPSSHIAAAACFRPRQLWLSNNCEEGESGKDLYDMLDTTTGISEWILPMVLAASLVRVEWIQPRLSPSHRSQIPLGKRYFHVGAWWETGNDGNKVQTFLDLPESAQVKVDWNCLYYRDHMEDNFAPTEELHLAQRLCLEVSTPDTLHDTNDEFVDTPWLLDVCLDYFVCANPFLLDLEEVSMEFAQALTLLVTNASVHKVVDEMKGEESRYDRESLVEFQSALAHLLATCERGQTQLDTLENTFEAALLPFYTCSDDLHNLLSPLISSLSGSKEHDKLCSLAIEAIPYLNLPHFPERSQSHDCLQSALDELDFRLARAATPPFMVTIARSYHDGFTPQNVVETLQREVLERIHKRFCRCKRMLSTMSTYGGEDNASNDSKQCFFEIILDYDEE